MAKIYLVDNSLKLLGGVQRSLKGAGFEAQTLPCLVSLIERARSEQPQLIITADGLKQVDARDFLQLRALDAVLETLPVVVVSATPRNKLEYFQLGCDDFIELPADEPELLFRVALVLKRVAATGLQGSFDEVSLVDIVQMLVGAQKSGCLGVEANGSRGALYFNEGQVIHAESGGVIGEDAFLALLRAARAGGGFQFRVQRVDVVMPTIDKRTDHLLLGLANTLDEEA